MTSSLSLKRFAPDMTSVAIGRSHCQLQHMCLILQANNEGAVLLICLQCIPAVSSYIFSQ